MVFPQRHFVVLPAGSCCDAGVRKMDISGGAASFQNVDTPGPIKMESPSLKNRRGANGRKVKIPRLKMRKNTRATIGGLMIAAASLWALAMAYDEARDNLLSFLFNTIVLLVLIAICAVCLVAVFYGLKSIMRRFSPKDPEDKQE